MVSPPGSVMRQMADQLILLALGLSACGGGGEAAADYPSKRVDYILPFDPGGESDITARLQQQPLEEALGQSVSISYKPGGGGALGWSELTRSRPDGYTVMGCTIPHIILQPMLRDDAGFETEQIKRVYFFQSTPNALIVAADSEMETVDDFVQAAKDNPGGLSVGGSGDFSANHIGTLQMADAAGIEVSYTPFDGTGAAVPALLGGHVDALMSYSPQIDQLGDQVKPLAVASEERMEGLDVPTSSSRASTWPTAPTAASASRRTRRRRSSTPWRRPSPVSTRTPSSSPTSRSRPSSWRTTGRRSRWS